MTDTFDYSGLASHVRAIALPHHASDVLRTRIEAAFVPVERYIERNRMWTQQVLATNEATARAEAAEARVEVLEKALRHISLGSQNSSTTKEHLGREARQALGGEHE